MKNETITVTNTESGQSMDVVVLDKRASQITVVIGEGEKSSFIAVVKTCKQTLTTMTQT